MEALKITFFPPAHSWNLLPGLTCTFSGHGFLAIAGEAILPPDLSINFSLTGDFFSSDDIRLAWPLDFDGTV